MSDIHISCAQCGGRGRLLRESASLTTPCGRCGGTGFVTMPDPQPEFTRLRKERDELREAALAVTSFIAIDAKMSGPVRKGIKYGGGLRNAIYAMDDLMAKLSREIK